MGPVGNAGWLALYTITAVVAPLGSAAVLMRFSHAYKTLGEWWAVAPVYTAVAAGRFVFDFVVGLAVGYGAYKIIQKVPDTKAYHVRVWRLAFVCSVLLAILGVLGGMLFLRLVPASSRPALEGDVYRFMRAPLQPIAVSLISWRYWQVSVRVKNTFPSIVMRFQ